MNVPMPQWLDTIADEDQDAARSRFLLRLAALYHSPEGKLNTLSEAVGFSPNSLAQLYRVSAPLAVSLEELLGRDNFPRELFRPDLFRTEA